MCVVSSTGWLVCITRAEQGIMKCDKLEQFTLMAVKVWCVSVCVCVCVCVCMCPCALYHTVELGSLVRSASVVTDGMGPY